MGKEGTFKKPAAPQVDQEQGKDLQHTLASSISALSQRFLQKFRSSKHVSAKIGRANEQFAKKSGAKKKRKRKITYRSQRINRIRVKGK